MSKNNLEVQNLDYKGIKQSLINFLRGSPEYKDWNFEGSGISRLLEILAYNAHHIGFYVKMLLGESSVDTAQTRAGLLSAAKRNGYLVRGERSARCDVIVKVTMDLQDEPSNKYITISEKTKLLATNTAGDNRTFILNNSVVVYDRKVEGNEVTYTTGTMTAYEGELIVEEHISDIENKRNDFALRNNRADVDTIKVKVISNTTGTNIFKKADDIFKVEKDSKVFYVSMNSQGYYHIFFGKNVMGLEPSDGDTIEISYVNTNGEEGNGARTFTFDATGYNPNYTFEVIPKDISSGGMEPQSDESLRFTIPNAYAMQNRIVTENDYKTILLSKFRNISSLNVWGGEKADVRDYGKVFVSIKPKDATSLSLSLKNEIKNEIMKPYSVVGADIKFVDPEFIDVVVFIEATIDPLKTNDPFKTIESTLVERSETFNEDVLDNFDTIFSELNYLTYLKGGEDRFKTLYTLKTLKKKSRISQRNGTQNTITFGNELDEGITVEENIFYASKRAKIIDINNELWIVNTTTEEKMTNKSIGKVDPVKGIITLSLPDHSYIDGFKGSNWGELTFVANPKYPDIQTSENNILRITQTKARVKA